MTLAVAGILPPVRVVVYVTVVTLLASLAFVFLILAELQLIGESE